MYVIVWIDDTLDIGPKWTLNLETVEKIKVTCDSHRYFIPNDPELIHTMGE